MTNGSTVGMEARGHAVHLSDDPSDLTVRVGEYLATALANDGVAVAAAAPAHLRALEVALPTHGVEVAGALREGTLVLIDAEDARDRLVGSGPLDPRAFQAIVGDVVRRHARPGRPTHVYGEIVALLWRDGLVAEALELETLWNALAEDVSFSLLCAYPAHLVAADGWREALDRVCSLHTSVTGRPDELAPSWTGQLEADDVSTRWFPCSSLAPKAARDFVA
ncbi:MAG TPA: MEDS domain-containing protein, partial [Actinomycetota bacterium]|nr:MEDS domain-containing protein [Actinomycetota bacterium]